MADSKDFLIGNKAKDLLKYTFTVTKPASEKSIETKDVLTTMLKIKDMSPDEARKFCEEAAARLKRDADKQGFPKSTVHSYIKLLRETAVSIVVNVQTANDCRFETEYDKRLEHIDKVLQSCNLMLQLIEISLELNYITLKRSEFWTKSVTDVKYMCLSWRRKDAGRAERLRNAAKSEEDAHLANIITEALKSAQTAN